MGKIYKNGILFAGSTENARSVAFDNADTDLESTNVQEAIEEIKSDVAEINSNFGQILFDKIYPIGSIYMNVAATNPSEFFGGTWVAWGAGRVPVGVNTTDNLFSIADITGGAKTNTHNHYTLTGFDGNAFYAASHNEAPRTTGKMSKLYFHSSNSVYNNATSSNTRRNSTENETISILQPYITCYMWKRIA